MALPIKRKRNTVVAPDLVGSVDAPDVVASGRDADETALNVGPVEGMLRRASQETRKTTWNLPKVQRTKREGSFTKLEGIVRSKATLDTEIGETRVKVNKGNEERSFMGMGRRKAEGGS